MTTTLFEVQQQVCHVAIAQNQGLSPRRFNTDPKQHRRWQIIIKAKSARKTPTEKFYAGYIFSYFGMHIETCLFYINEKKTLLRKLMIDQLILEGVPIHLFACCASCLICRYRYFRCLDYMSTAGTRSRYLYISKLTFDIKNSMTWCFEGMFFRFHHTFSQQGRNLIPGPRSSEAIWVFAEELR